MAVAPPVCVIAPAEVIVILPLPACNTGPSVSSFEPTLFMAILPNTNEPVLSPVMLVCRVTLVALTRERVVALVVP